jgi:hypothetical protein
VVIGEAGVLVHGVGTDPDHLGAGLGEHLVAVTEGTGLGGTPSGLVLGVEVQHHNVLAEPVAEPYRLAGLGRKGEVGGLVPRLDTAGHAAASSLQSARSLAAFLVTGVQVTVRVTGMLPRVALE